MHWSDLFIIVYLLIAWCWNYPDDAPQKWLVKPLTRVVQWLGLWHSWNMFAPNPVRESRRLAVQVEYADGSKYEWRPPGTLKEGYWQDFLHAHHRKFTEVVCSGKVKALQWSVVDFAIRQLAGKAATAAAPVHVMLIEEKWPVKLDVLEQPSEPVRKTLFEQKIVDGVFK